MSTYLEELAVRFVERDGLSLEDQQKIASDAADYVLDPAKLGYPQDQTVLTLVKSIHRWVASGDDDEISDFADRNREKHARGLKYLAMTLTALPQDFLLSTQIKMLSGFFSSIFQHQDPAGLAAATDALLVLISMNNFPPSAADDILASVGKMEPENFTKQLAKTRWQVFQIIKTLLLNDKSARVLQKRYEGGAFLLPVLALAKRERDPVNLLDWFQTLETVLGKIQILPDVSRAAFESFSPFFPISIRKSTASGPEVTEDDLKEKLRSCFAANGLLAQHTFQFLLEKLDDGGTLTASAKTKLDILRTIKACVASYEPVDTNLVPYVTKLWSSLKYEVRNGEIPEAIKETLSIFECLPSRLSKSNDPDAALTEFLSQVWKDTAEDLENPTYTEQAGSILISIAGGNMLAYCRTSPRLLEAVRRHTGQPKSPVHTKNLLVLLNNLVRTRRRLESKLNEWSDDDKRAFSSESFEIPMTVIDDVYFKLFRENTIESPTKDQAEIAEEAIKGLALVAELQQITSGWCTKAAYGQDVLKEMCTALSYRATNSFNVPVTASQELHAIDVAAVEALKTVVKVYPKGYAKILQDLVSEVEKREWTGKPAERTFNDLHAVCQRVAFIGCADIPDGLTPIVNFASFAGTMLNILSVLFNGGANIRSCAVVGDALATGMAYFVKVMENNGLKQVDDIGESWQLDALNHLVHEEIPDFPRLAHKEVNLYDPIASTESVKAAGHTLFTSFLLVGVHVVSELYQHATTPHSSAEGAAPVQLLSDALVSATGIERNSPLGRDYLIAYLEELGRAATLVLRELSPSAQQYLDLDDKIVGAFHDALRWSNGKEWSFILHGDKEVYTLSCGIAQAMRPQVVVTMMESNFHNLLIGNLDLPTAVDSRAQALQDFIAFLIANKFDTRGNASDRDIQVPNQDEWAKVLQRVEEGLTRPEFLELKEVCRFAAILTGAFARRDRQAALLASTVSQAAAKAGTEMGPYVARILSQLFSSSKSGILNPANHTIQKPLYLQWTYGQCVQAVLGLAYPLSRDATSIVYSIYVLHAVKNLALSHYADDAPRVVRIVLAAMQKARNSYDIQAACGIALHVLGEEPTLFRSHIASLVKAAKSVYGRVLPVPLVSEQVPLERDEAEWPEDKEEYAQDARFRYAGDKEKIRRLSLKVLQVLPAQFDEIDLRAYADEVRIHLAVALGDRVRDVRRAAEAAQTAWARIST